MTAVHRLADRHNQKEGERRRESEGESEAVRVVRVDERQQR
jgi:hypothetical protein